MRSLLSMLCVVLVIAVGGSAHAAEDTPAKQGRVVVVQAVPDARVDVSVNGKALEAGVTVGALVGPVSLSAGENQLSFSEADGQTIDSRLEVESGSNSDVVLHQPASVGGDPVVSVYPTPDRPIGPDRARVLIAHTATVAPADVVLDGKVVFRNIANGEFSTADIAAGEHTVSLRPAGTEDAPILGPIDVRLEPRTATMVYAVGNPEQGSMDVISRVEQLAPDGAVIPERIDTGSAGLASGVAVTAFDRRSGNRGVEEVGSPASWVVAGLVLALLPVLLRSARRRFGPATGSAPS